MLDQNIAVKLLGSHPPSLPLTGNQLLTALHQATAYTSKPEVKVGVHCEGPAPLTTAHRTKIATYSDPGFVATLQRKFASRDISIKAYIFGARCG